MVKREDTKNNEDNQDDGDEDNKEKGADWTREPWLM